MHFHQCVYPQLYNSLKCGNEQVPTTTTTTTTTTPPAPINICDSGSAITTSTGTLSDGPGNYANKLNCAKVFSFVPGTTITLAFSSFQTDNGYDFLFINDGTNSEDKVYSGNLGAFSTTMTLSTGLMVVSFGSDSFFAYAGFEFTWTATPPGTPVTAVFDTTAYTDGSPRAICSGNFIQADSGYMEDGSGASNYGLVQCATILKFSPSTTVGITYIVNVIPTLCWNS